jgi:predicted nucleic acid-binding protein
VSWLLDVNLMSRGTTDAHLVTLAKRHGLQLATLDATLLAKPWAAGIAENPLPQATQS